MTARRLRSRPTTSRTALTSARACRCAWRRTNAVESRYGLTHCHRRATALLLCVWQAAGGQVIWAGCWRVQGDLAVSRAFGDAHLKPYGVSSTPELSAISLTPRDAFLVLASDGLWDVVDEQQCARSVARWTSCTNAGQPMLALTICILVRRCASSVLRASDPLGAARALCDLASARGSMDNITVLVVAL